MQIAAPLPINGAVSDYIAPAARHLNGDNWYTVWDAKTGDLIASGTSAMVARRLGYKSTTAFTTHYAHTQTRKPKKPYKYIMRRDLIERREAELPPPRTREKGRKHHEDCH